MSASKNDIQVGDMFGYLEVKEVSPRGGQITCFCTACRQQTKVIRASVLRAGQGKSCGCMKRALQQQGRKEAAKRRDQVAGIVGQKFACWEILEKDGIWATCRCVCGNIGRVHMWNLKKGKSKSCGCNKRENRERTCLEKYGVENYAKTEEWQKRKTATEVEKYGTNYVNTEAFKQRRRETFLEKYGVDNPAKNPQVMEKRKQTLLEKYGVDHQSKCPEIRDRMQEGIRTAWQERGDEIRQKIQETNLERYGVKHYPQTNEHRERSRATCLAKYGVEYHSQLEGAKEQKRQTNQQKFGTDHYFQTEDYRGKAEETLIEKYGSKYISQTEHHKQKMIENGLWYDFTDEQLKERENYYRAVWTLTEQEVRKYAERFEARGKEYHVDHIYSIGEGFINNIQPVIIASIVNLQLLKGSINSGIKKNACWISKDELFERYRIHKEEL